MQVSQQASVQGVSTVIIENGSTYSYSTPHGSKADLLQQADEYESRGALNMARASRLRRAADELTNPGCSAGLAQAAEIASLRESARKLREYGYAVTIFSPDELGQTSPESLQNRLIELGNEAIDDLQG